MQMKRWTWLLVPYVVLTTTIEYVTMNNGHEEVVGWTIAGYPCGATKEMCDDMAFALNEAHKKRTKPIGKLIVCGDKECSEHDVIDPLREP